MHLNNLLHQITLEKFSKIPLLYSIRKVIVQLISHLVRTINLKRQIKLVYSDLRKGVSEMQVPLCCPQFPIKHVTQVGN